MTADISSAMVNVIGAIAAVCSTLGFIPQLLKICRDKASEELSIRMYVLTVSAFALWSVYGVMLGSWPLVVANVISLGLASAILVLQLRFRGQARLAAGRARQAPRDRPRAGTSS